MFAKNWVIHAVIAVLIHFDQHAYKNIQWRFKHILQDQSTVCIA